MAIHLTYFEDSTGHIQLPPTSDIPAPPGYQRSEANTLDEVDKLQARMQRQEADELERAGIREEVVWGQRLAEQRSKLIALVRSSTTTEYEKEFLMYWMQLRDEKRKAYFKSRFSVDIAARAFFEQREYDTPRTPEELMKESL